MQYSHVVCFLADHLTLITTSNRLIRPSRMTLWLCSTHPVTWSGSGGVACKLLSQWVAVAFTSNWRHQSSAEAIATKSMSWLVSCGGTAIVTECVALSLLYLHWMCWMHWVVLCVAGFTCLTASTSTQTTTFGWQMWLCTRSVSYFKNIRIPYLQYG